MGKDVFENYCEYVAEKEEKDGSEVDSELSERLGKVEQAIASVNTLLEKMIEKGEENNVGDTYVTGSN